MVEPTCVIEGCEDAVHAKDRCNRHYRKALRAKDPAVMAPKPERLPCSADGCTLLRMGNQPWCNKHYQRVLRNGDLATKKPGPKPKDGSESTCLPCSRCGKSKKATITQRRRYVQSGTFYCSRECQTGDNFVPVPCAGCGKDVMRYKHALRPGQRVFHNATCRNLAPKERTGEMVPCEWCGIEFYVIPAMRELRRFHSKECKSAWERSGRPKRDCLVCGTPIDKPASLNVKYCSRVCNGVAQRADVGHRYIDPNTGYAWVHVEDGNGRMQRVQEHRWVMEQHIGRPLLSSETVHHLSGGKKGRSDNRLENLELWSRRHTPGHRVADIVAYCREMLGLYGDNDEHRRYGEYAKVMS